MECVVCGAPSPPHDCSRTTLIKSHHVVGNLSQIFADVDSFQLRHGGTAFPVEQRWTRQLPIFAVLLSTCR